MPALILSGGEPLLRPDLFEIAARARELGLFLALSTNGTLIDAAAARRIAARFDYVGVSLDGRPPTHDLFRRSAGAFERSLAALRRLRDAAAKVGKLEFAPTDAVEIIPKGHLLLRCKCGKEYAVQSSYSGMMRPCPKCGMDEVAFVWCRGKKRVGHYGPLDSAYVRYGLCLGGEHLHRHCHGCGYEWLEACVDTAPADNEQGVVA